ncbi:gamma-glutamyltransferase domain protein [Burkholderia pseudomallei MSHR3709]|nr:gamma-glutamyltransferase domain protein [Burkholderia pseudomallei MSHR3709]
MIAARGATAARRSRFVGARAAAPRGGDLSRGGSSGRHAARRASPHPCAGLCRIGSLQVGPAQSSGGLVFGSGSGSGSGTALARLWLGSARCDAQRNATQRNATQRNATQRNATRRNATQRNATQFETMLPRPIRSGPPPPPAFPPPPRPPPSRPRPLPPHAPRAASTRCAASAATLAARARTAALAGMPTKPHFCIRARPCYKPIRRTFVPQLARRSKWETSNECNESFQVDGARRARELGARRFSAERARPCEGPAAARRAGRLGRRGRRQVQRRRGRGDLQAGRQRGRRRGRDRLHARRHLSGGGQHRRRRLHDRLHGRQAVLSRLSRARAARRDEGHVSRQGR